MHLVLLDASTLTRQGDLDLEVLGEFGTFDRHPTTSPHQVADRCKGAGIVITNKVVLDAETLGQLPDLRLIQVAATGTNNVDLDAAAERDITVCNVSGYSTDSVAQHTIGFIINLASSLPSYFAERSQWANSPIFTRLEHPVTELAGKRLGLVGAGTIGTRVGHIAEALGMEVVAWQRDPAPQESTTPEGWPRLPKAEMLATSDFVSLHCPLTRQTRNFIDREALEQMKSSAFLVNTGRGPLVDEKSLRDALEAGDIAGAGLDVLSSEPPDAGHPLLTLQHPGLLISPHTAWASLEARTRLLNGIVANLRAYLAGDPQNVVRT